MAEKRVIELQVKTNSKEVVQDLNETTQAVENLSSEVQDAGKKSGVFNDIKNVIGKFVPAFKAAETGAVGFGASLKALMANPIILVITGIVGALKFVYEAFQNTVVGAKAIDRVWSGLSVVITNLKDGLFGLTRALAYSIEAGIKFISLDFEGASEAMSKANKEASSSWDTLTKAVNGTTFSIEQNLKKREQANAKYKKTLEVQESEINKLLLQSRETLTDESAAINEKKKALELVTREETKYSANKLRAAKEDKDIAEARLAQAKKGTVTEKELKATLREATIALNNAEAENAAVGIRLNRQRKMLYRQEIADGKAAVAQAKENAKIKEEAEKEYNNKLREYYDAIESERQSKIIDAQEKEIQEINNKYEKLYKLADVANQNDKDLIDAHQKELIAIDEKYKLIKAEKNRKAQQEADKLKIQAENDYLLQIENLQEDNYLASLSQKNKEVQLVNDKYFALEQAAKGNAEQEKIIAEAKQRELDKIDKEANDKRIENEKNVKNAKIQIAKDSLALISDITSLFGQRNEKEAKKAFQIDKAAKLASATISGIEGTINAYTTAQKSPITALFPAYPAIQAGLAGAFAAVNIAKISQTQFQGGNNNIDSSNAPMGGASQSMTPQFNVVGGNQTSQLLQGLSAQPLKAYVVASDITTAQMLEQKAIKTSVL
jgi:hypothetical protein